MEELSDGCQIDTDVNDNGIGNIVEALGNCRTSSKTEHSEDGECGSVSAKSHFKKKRDRTPKLVTPHVCRICNKVCQAPSDLAKHVRVHTGEKPYKCEECGKAFAQSSNLNEHTRVHSGELPFKCDKCGKGFTTTSNLKSHMRKHTGAKPYLCELCGSAFSSKSYQLFHELTHSGERPYKCDECGKAFKTKKYLRKHKLVLGRHTPKGIGEKAFKCEECGDTFPFAKRLRDHMVVHTENKSLECKQYGINFVQPLDLKEHTKVCDAVKTQCKCEECDIVFEKGYQLDRHIKNHFAIKPAYIDLNQVDVNNDLNFNSDLSGKR